MDAGFGQQQTMAGTAHVKYNPVLGTGVVVKAGTSQNVSIKLHCITCMKDYESKSLEELRLEDYVAGRKGASGGMFGGFQQTENKTLFGGNTFGQPATTSAPSLFGTGIGSTSAFGQTSLFGASTSNTGLFGNTATPSTFGQSSGFGFGASTSSGGLFSNDTGTGLFAGNQNNTAFGSEPTDESSEEICQNLQSIEAFVNCRTIQIGSYRYTPKEKVHISLKGIKIVAPSLKNESREVALQIPLKEIVGIFVHFDKGLPVVFLHTMNECGVHIRKALHMVDESNFYYNPMSEEDLYKRITLLPEVLTEDAKHAFKTLSLKVMDELSNREANEI